ncbi:TNT domain-containing protein [Photorhabdus heterorhabditis]|uniref:TNT domain-containing protein n=1 Tax=Photorhabdus heterorhabditis TaxID=880156 RepID=UPI0030EE4D2A
MLSNEQMTPQKAAEIVAGGIPTSEAKLIQFAAAKMYLSLNKYQEVSSSLEKTSRNFNKDSAITDSESGGYSSYDKFRKSNTEWNWPPKLGFAEPPKEDVLAVGTRLDRYGSANGVFLSPKGVPYENRALAPGSKVGKYHEYEVIKPLPILQGKIAPAFDQPRGGVQILPNFPERVNVDWLIKNGYVKEVKNVNYK